MIQEMDLTLWFDWLIDLDGCIVTTCVQWFESSLSSNHCKCYTCSADRLKILLSKKQTIDKRIHLVYCLLWTAWNNWNSLFSRSMASSFMGKGASTQPRVWFDVTWHRHSEEYTPTFWTPIFRRSSSLLLHKFYLLVNQRWQTISLRRLTPLPPSFKTTTSLI